MTNSQRFLDAYNRVDKALHSRFGLKPSMPFSDAVRRAASLNAVVRRFEDDLIDYARLRNAIVHNSDSTRTIAEPHDDVTDHFEHIADMLSKPPFASGIAHEPTILAPDTPLGEAIRLMGERDYSIMPVVEGKTVVGALTNKDVAEFIAGNIGGLDKAVGEATVSDALSTGRTYLEIMRDVPVDEVLRAFEKNRKLRMVLITSDGSETGRIRGIITVGDLVTVAKMLDTY